MSGIKVYDAVIIGSGCAGFNAADCLHKNGISNIAIVTEDINSGTSRNAGSDKQTYYKLSLSGEAEDSVAKMTDTLFSGGCVDGDVALAEAANSVYSFLKLERLGVKFPKNEFGEFVGYKTDHDPMQRATSVGPYTSKKMTEALEREVLRNGTKILDGLQCVKILTDENGVYGIVVIDKNNLSENYGLSVIFCNNAILCTGGPAIVYADSVYPEGHTGSSSLAYEAGAVFCNMAEWQYGLASVDFRWNVSGTYQQVLPRYISVDAHGNEREFLPDYFEDERKALESEFLKGYEWPFDVCKINASSKIDIAVYTETVIKGNKVFMDFTRNPSFLESGCFSDLPKVVYEYLEKSGALTGRPIDRLRIMNEKAIALYADHGIDITKKPLSIAVCAQHNNGGIDVDSDWQTSIGGLYAVGECAATFGISRPGGTALNSTQVGGMRCARRIAFYSDKKFVAPSEKVIAEELKKTADFIKSCKGSACTVYSEREKRQKQMSKFFAFFRNVVDMKKVLKEYVEEENDFPARNKWKEPLQIPDLFKNKDMEKMQRIIAECIIITATDCGSRGGAFATNGKVPTDEKPLEEKKEERNKRIFCVKSANEPEFGKRDVRPVPVRNNWFERVWKTYDEKECLNNEI